MPKQPKRYIRTYREFQVTNTNGSDTLFTDVTPKGLDWAIAQYNEWMDEFQENRTDADDVDAPRLELYTQYQETYDSPTEDDRDWEQYACPDYHDIQDTMPTRHIQNLVDRKLKYIC